MFRGDQLQSPAFDEKSVSGPDSVRWANNALVVYGAAMAGSSLAAVYKRLVQPAPSVALLAAANDERDLIDQGIDVLITENPAVTDYGNRSRAHQTVALPLTRLYVVVAPVGVDLPAGVASTLARGITAETPVIADDNVTVCVPGEQAEQRAASVTRGSRGRVLYDETDAAARDLASRIVALASQGRLMRDHRQELAANGVDQRSVLEQGLFRDDDFVVLRLRAPRSMRSLVPGDQPDDQGCVPVPDVLLAKAGDRRAIAVAWVREHAVLASDALIVIDIDGLPIARRAQRGSE